MYIIIILIGVIINFILNYFQLKNKNVSKKDIIIIEILNVSALIIGSKLLDVLVNLEVYISHDFNYNVHTGSMFYGGFILSIIVIAIYNKIRKIENINKIIINNNIILYAIWKLGCFFNGCCSGIYNFPLQLFEFMICIIFYLLLNKTKKTEYLLLLFAVERMFSIILRNEINEKNMIINIFISSAIFMIVLINNIYLKKKNTEK